MKTPTEIEQLVAALNFYDYARARDTTNAAGVDYDAAVTKLLQHGIGDLDFDPHFFLGTEKTTPQGWSSLSKNKD